MNDFWIYVYMHYWCERVYKDENYQTQRVSKNSLANTKKLTH